MQKRVHGAAQVWAASVRTCDHVMLAQQPPARRGPSAACSSTVGSAAAPAATTRVPLMQRHVARLSAWLAPKW